MWVCRRTEREDREELRRPSEVRRKERSVEHLQKFKARGLPHLGRCAGMTGRSGHISLVLLLGNAVLARCAGIFFLLHFLP